MANFVYIIGDPQTKRCAVVDPAWDVTAIREAIEKSGWRLSCILATHNHFDHINGVAELLEHADVPVYIHVNDAYALKELKGNVRPTRGGDKVELGKLDITFLHTPGHTEGSQCFLFADRLLSGDTLFIRGCGRVDLPNSDPEKMYQSLRKIASLDDQTVVFPGHNYAEAPCAPLASEKKHNPYLKLSVTQGLGDFLRLVGL